MIEVEEGLFISECCIIAIQETGAKKCRVYVKGRVDPFDVRRPALELADILDEEDEDDEPEPHKGKKKEDPEDEDQS